MTTQNPSPTATELRLQRWLVLTAMAAVAGCVVALLLWQRLGSIQEQLARQSAESSAHALEARNTARLAQDTAMQTAAKLAVTDARLDEVAMQRSQLEELIKNMTRSRDENLLIDMDAALRLAIQQSQLTGSMEPILAALKSGEARLNRVSQPHLTSVQRAITHDIAQISAISIVDTPSLLIKLDELIAMSDDLMFSNAVAHNVAAKPLKKQTGETVPDWWQRLRDIALDEMRSLVRVSKIASPEAALLSPEQSFFLRENLKLTLLNARMGLLARQHNAVRTDLKAASAMLLKYADQSAPRTKIMVVGLQQLHEQTRQMVLPQLDETFSALAMARAGR